MESRLSGVQKLLNPGQALWYRRLFRHEKNLTKRSILHFEAVDYHCQVWLNGQFIGRHVGGNIPFHFDVSEAVQQGNNELILRVEDETGGTQLRGKQRIDPQGIWYTRVSGIWQTVWMEEVSPLHITALKVRTKIDGTISISVSYNGQGEEEMKLSAVASLDGDVVAEHAGSADSIQFKISNPRLWSPDSPVLYDLKVQLGSDVVESYLGIREVGKMRDEEGHLRFTLNGNPIFHWGPLDQGWWPDGLLTPPADEAMQI